ncbi:hypothetical protein PLESTB_000766800 [Pleodorina starrii]|uniref:Uncharacterized protein n=1 Tax=Pleodorina starrii TaxID=330485 RepID=A0A9W6BK04_9CHLO|nr:hypothetical protein PLESTB_000766800 [Pleodorina starrii]GLC65708.1 hypothetical protein PLESTF_000331500 [Pleodorina starrii]
MVAVLEVVVISLVVHVAALVLDPGTLEVVMRGTVSRAAAAVTALLKRVVEVAGLALKVAAVVLVTVVPLGQAIREVTAPVALLVVVEMDQGMLPSLANVVKIEAVELMSVTLVTWMAAEAGGLERAVVAAAAGVPVAWVVAAGGDLESWLPASGADLGTRGVMVTDWERQMAAGVVGQTEVAPVTWVEAAEGPVRLITAAAEAPVTLGVTRAVRLARVLEGTDLVTWVEAVAEAEATADPSRDMVAAGCGALAAAGWATPVVLLLRLVALAAVLVAQAL